jgi:hypothetical protein
MGIEKNKDGKLSSSSLVREMFVMSKVAVMVGVVEEGFLVDAVFDCVL